MSRPRALSPLFMDFTLSECFLFPQMKKLLKGKHFAAVEEVKRKTAETLKGINVDELKHCGEQWDNVSIGYCIGWRGL